MEHKVKKLSFLESFKWVYFSLIKNEIILHPMCNRNLESINNKYNQGYDKRFNLERIDYIKS